MKLKKTKKSVRQRGNTTHGHGARKKWKKSGHRGGCGMAGTGKRGDQKKTLIIKKYGNTYFGKQGITSRRTAKKRNKIINLGRIEKEYDSLMERFGKAGILDLSDYKLLGEGELNKKVKLKVKEASQGVVERVEKIGGSVKVLKKKTTSKSNDENIINTKQDKGSKVSEDDDSSDLENINESKKEKVEKSIKSDSEDITNNKNKERVE